MAEQLGNQSLKEHKKEYTVDGGLIDILRAEIKAILQVKIKNILNQAPNSKDEIILSTGNPNDKGVPSTSNSESNKRKRVMTMP